MNDYENLMRKCISLAKQGSGNTSPNPLVGCVIINDDGEIVSTGYHAKCGQNHAERDALLKPGDYRGCTLIVNLEPCSHYGKTPPCADLIIEKGIKKVVYGMQDPNPIVNSNGLKKLKAAGIEIAGPVLEDECKKLNEIFIKNQLEHKTFVALKTATTIDGKIASYNGNSKWITSDNARNKVKEIRAQYDAILTSSSTVIADNPTMAHKNKVILDRLLKTDIHSKIYEQGNIFVFCEKDMPSSVNITYIKTPIENDKLNIEFILNTLYKRGIMSVLVEAGGILNGSFLPYIDKLYHFTAPKILSDNRGKSCFAGAKAERISDCVNLKYETTEIYPPDILNIYFK